MILQHVDGRLLVVRQTDHGDQTGLIASAWDEAASGAGGDDHHRAAHLAARHHDDGWALWERHPSLDPATDQPYQFLALPPTEHLPMYRAGIERTATLDPWTGLLVSMHGAGLYNDRYGSYRLVEQHFNAEEQALVDEFMADMALLQARLAGPAGITHRLRPVDDPALWRAYLLLQIWDRLSLELLGSFADQGKLAPVPGADGARTALTCRRTGPYRLSIEPYPFDTPVVELPIHAVFVDDRPYRNPEDFLAAVAASRPTVLECRVVA